MPRYCVETSWMTTYRHTLLKLICQQAFWPVLGFMEVSRTKNWSNICQKYIFCPVWISDFQSSAWILCRDLFNDYHDIWLKLICKHALWHVLGFMVISIVQRRWKIYQISQIWLPVFWIIKLKPNYCDETFPFTIYGHIWLKVISACILIWFSVYDDF